MKDYYEQTFEKKHWTSDEVGGGRFEACAFQNCNFEGVNFMDVVLKIVSLNRVIFQVLS